MGHTTEVQNAKEATCTEDGYTGDTVCTVCGETVEAGEVIPATGHTEGEVVVENEVAATCTEDGSYDNVVYCTVCDAEVSRETVTVPATGHSYEAVVTEPTCTEGGYTTYTCSVCGDSYVADETEALGHTTEVQNAKEATCTEDGYTGDTVCTVCGETVEAGEVIPATGHTEGEVVVENEVAATCTEDGSYDNVVYCTVCDAEVSRETVTVPATGHSYEAVVTEPTCTEGGYTTYTCSVCGDSYVADETEALGHTTEVQNAKEATCTEDGYTGDTVCTVCGETVEAGEVIPATGHTPAEEVVNAKDATCTEDGYTGDTVCTECGEVIEEGEVIPATGHSEGVLQLIDGVWYVVCPDCGEILS